VQQDGQFRPDYQYWALRRQSFIYYRSEIAQGSFVRTVALPAEANGSKCKATFKNGVLELVAPKLKHAQRHKITVE
jgi:HSP20 family protein